MRLVVSFVCFMSLVTVAVAQTTGSGNNNGNGNSGLASGNGNGNTGTLSGNLSGSLSGNSVSQTTKFSQKTAPSIASPGLAAAAVESCLGSISGGISGSGIGITLGGTITDKACNLRLYARTLYAMGHKVAATQILCNDPDVAQALAIEGVGCLVGARAPTQGPYSGNIARATPVPNQGQLCRNYDFFFGCRD